MTMTARLLAAAIAIAVVALGGALILRPGGQTNLAASTRPSSSAPSGPSDSTLRASVRTLPTPSGIGPLDRTFHSPLFGYAIELPASWDVSAATTVPQSITSFSAFDEFHGPLARLLIFAARPPAGTSPREWVESAATRWPSPSASNLASPCPPSPEHSRIEVSGHVAYMTHESCGSLGPFHRWDRAVLATADRVYVFQFDSDEFGTDAFLALLGSLRLTT